MVSFALTTRCFAYIFDATIFYRLQRGFGGRRQSPHDGNIFITPLPTIIVRHWFVRINVRCGFPNDKLILRTFDTFEKHSPCIQLFSVKQPRVKQHRCLADTIYKRIPLVHPSHCFPSPLGECDRKCVALLNHSNMISCRFLTMYQLMIAPESVWNPIRTLVVTSPMA